MASPIPPDSAGGLIGGYGHPASAALRYVGTGAARQAARPAIMGA